VKVCDKGWVKFVKSRVYMYIRYGQPQKTTITQLGLQYINAQYI